MTAPTFTARAYADGAEIMLDGQMVVTVDAGGVTVWTSGGRSWNIAFNSGDLVVARPKGNAIQEDTE